MATLAEMYVQGVSTRKVKAITEELCGHAFSASPIWVIKKRLDESLKAFAERPLPGIHPSRAAGILGAARGNVGSWRSKRTRSTMLF